MTKKQTPITLPFWQISEIYDYIHEIRGKKATKEQTRLKGYVMAAICESVKKKHKGGKSL